jgi:cytochrome c556
VIITIRWKTCGLAGLAFAVASAAAPGAQQQSGASAGPQALVPVAASTLADSPDTFFGAYVTMSGAVEQRLSRSVFTVDQDRTKATGREVLVVAPSLTAPVDLNTYVTVLGEVMHLDAAQIASKAKDYALDLAPDVIDKYRDRPVVLALAVVNAAGVDVARRLPPPLTREEEAYSRVMKRVSPAFNALRKSIEGSDAAVAKENVVVLKQAFAETEAFWKTKGKTDALQLAQDARKQVDSIERSVAAGKWDEIKNGAADLTKMCQSCHAAYRERLDDGSYRIKGLSK